MRPLVVEHDGEGLLVAIPGRSHPAVLALLAVGWLPLWALGEVAVVRFFPFFEKTGQVLASIWFCAWTAGGAAAMYHLYFALAGKQLLRVCNGRLELWREPPRHFSRTFPLDSLRGLHIAQPPELDAAGTPHRIRFHSGAREVRLGVGLSDFEAEQVRAALAAHGVAAGEKR